MIPPPIFNSGQIERAEILGQTLKNSGADVIVFQEVFMRKARRKLHSILSSVYPYQTSKPQGGSLFTVNSGVWIISKYPIREIAFVKYRQKKGVDARSGKGALLVKLNYKNEEVFIIGTHVQADNYQDIRYAQFQQIVDELYPLIPENSFRMVVGDLNTDKFVRERYEKMLNILQMNDCELTTEEKYSCDGIRNDLSAKFFKSDERERLDYTLYQENPKWDCVESQIKIYRSNRAVKGKFYDLSDHYAIFSKFRIKH